MDKALEILKRYDALQKRGLTEAEREILLANWPVGKKPYTRKTGERRCALCESTIPHKTTSLMYLTKYMEILDSNAERKEWRSREFLLHFCEWCHEERYNACRKYLQIRVGELRRRQYVTDWHLLDGFGGGMYTSKKCRQRILKLLQL
jgi:hypothetical protein